MRAGMLQALRAGQTQINLSEGEREEELIPSLHPSPFRSLAIRPFFLRGSVISV